MPKSDTWFTPANAREMSAKAHAAKANRIVELRQAVETATLDPDASSFQAKTLARVRLQMQAVQTKLDDLLTARDFDSKAFKELTEAFSRLEVADQKLSGRAAPGSLRPSTKGKRERGDRAKPEAE